LIKTVPHQPHGGHTIKAYVTPPTRKSARHCHPSTEDDPSPIIWNQTQADAGQTQSGHRAARYGETDEHRRRAADKAIAAPLQGPSASTRLRVDTSARPARSRHPSTGADCHLAIWNWCRWRILPSSVEQACHQDRRGNSERLAGDFRYGRNGGGSKT
jgi:hypothetical protein